MYHLRRSIKWSSSARGRCVRLSHRSKNNNFAITNTLARSSTVVSALPMLIANRQCPFNDSHVFFFFSAGDKNIQQCSSSADATAFTHRTSIVSRMSNLFWQLLHLPFALTSFFFFCSVFWLLHFKWNARAVLSGPLFFAFFIVNFYSRRIHHSRFRHRACCLHFYVGLHSLAVCWLNNVNELCWMTDLVLPRPPSPLPLLGSEEIEQKSIVNNNYIKMKEQN